MRLAGRWVFGMNRKEDGSMGRKKILMLRQDAEALQETSHMHAYCQLTPFETSHCRFGRPSSVRVLLEVQ